jgi:CHAT domain-containing protein
MNETVSRHPEARALAAFVEGALAPAELAAVAEHLRGCPDCRTVVTETARFEREEQRSAAPARSVRWWWLAAAAAVVAALITIPLLRWNESRQAAPIARLVEAAPRGHRTVDARLSGFRWARLQAPPRGDMRPDPADLKLSGAAGDVLEKSANDKTPASRHAAGVAYLLIGRRPEAVAKLEQAATRSNDPRVWSDLAAARYAAAVHDEHPAQLPEALADADRALRLDPKLPEAHFNRALILEALGLRDRAKEEWQRYLEIDGGSDWAVEARAHLRSLTSNAARFNRGLLESAPPDQLVRNWPQETRTWSEVELLGDWADASNDPIRAAGKLARVRLIANALASFNGEHLLDDAVAAIERSSPETRRALAEGHALYRKARKEYHGRGAGAAEPQFLHAATLFRRGGSPMADVAAYYAASAAFDQHGGSEARNELARLLASIDRDRHRALAAQIRWQLAVNENTEGDWGSGARDAEASAAIFRALGERSNAAFLDAVAAVAFEMMGESDLAWSRRIRANAGLSTAAEPSLQRAVLHSAAITLSSLDRSRTAESFIDLMIDDARGDPVQLAAALSDRARNAVRAGDFEIARRSLVEARGAATRIRDPGLREFANAQVGLADATLRRGSDPRAAIASLDQTIALAGGGFRFLLPEAYLQRGRAFRAIGDGDAALADLSAALREVQQQRSTIRDAALRLSFLDTAAQIVEETVDLQLSRGAGAEAFAVADEAHTLLGAGPHRSDAPSPAKPSVRHGAAIVEYMVLPHAVALFYVSSEGMTAETVAVERGELAARIDSFTEKIRLRGEIGEIHGEGAALHRLLIAPLRLRLSDIDELVLVPDRQLHAVPFAALWDEARHSYLAEELTLRVAPSAPTATMGGDRSLSPALVIADPPTARWPRLVASREEAARIASLQRATLLEGTAATRAAFLEKAKGSALIHYAGHADSDPAEAYGALLLAREGSDSGVLGSGEIARLALTKHPLVVLAACGTFRGKTHVGGMSSLARSFLVAGARGVVGTLWEVDDDVSGPLFFRFHEHLRAGASPAQALRAAQTEMIHAPDARLRHPATWSSIEYLGNV